MTQRPQQEVAGLVLAAGAGSRFGAPKAALRRDGRSFLAVAVEALRGGGCEGPLLAVLAPGMGVPADVGACEIVLNGAWEEGMGSSLRAGLAALRDRPVRAAVVTLVDTPTVSAAHVTRLLDAYAAGAALAAAAYGGRRRTPVLLGREHWLGVTEAARGDAGARGYLDAHPDRVELVECGDLGPWRDVDTPAELRGP